MRRAETPERQQVALRRAILVLAALAVTLLLSARLNSSSRGGDGAAQQGAPLHVRGSAGASGRDGAAGAAGAPGGGMADSSGDGDCAPAPTVNGEPKAAWPELLGMAGEEAAAVVRREAPSLQVQVLGADMMATMDYRCDRVRIWLDTAGHVARPPRIG